MTDNPNTVILRDTKNMVEQMFREHPQIDEIYKRYIRSLITYAKGLEEEKLDMVKVILDAMGKEKELIKTIHRISDANDTLREVLEECLLQLTKPTSGISIVRAITKAEQAIQDIDNE